ncbi:hypothetical protein FN846DRAFT_766596, partial [Sphaerosporella brunnea]
TVVANRPKRVRTGSLTCRERHLKCDEGTPDCQNCRKSSRICKRGVRLNFIDIQTEQPPVIPISDEWKGKWLYFLSPKKAADLAPRAVDFQDESRDIASEYAGGVKRYAPFINAATPVRTKNSPPTPRSNLSSMGSSAASSLSTILPPTLPKPPHASHSADEDSKSHHQSTSTYSDYTSSPSSRPPRAPRSDHTLSPAPRETRSYLENAEETLFMQVFVEEVGTWMDSLDPLKHFSRLLPFNSLREPMLLNAFLACGARHLTLVNPAYKEDKALQYYNTATGLILASIQNQSRATRDTEICATTAIILNVYEIMSEHPLQRMNHIAGARALLRECHWNARTPSVGGACFWLNVTMEILSCLRFNWQVSWDPDEWCLDMDFNRQCQPGREELWAHRIIYILAKIANFRASLKATEYMDAETTQKRYQEWKGLYDLCVAWNDRIPRNMHPMAHLQPYQTAHKSVFPQVWLIKRCVIVARLFYHTAMVLMAKINPYDSEEMREMALTHAHQVCGIAAHVKDRGVASVALRSLANAAECLEDHREQQEVLEIFDKIKKETGWKVAPIQSELKDKWGWEGSAQLPQPSSL